MTEVTRILNAIDQGDAQAAEQLLPLVYAEPRRLAAQKLSHEKPDQWDAFADQACGDDRKLRRRVQVLLEAHAAEGSLLDQPAIVPIATIDTPQIAEGPGTLIGRYRLLELIGRGGFGDVYLAEQTEPVRRQVALKIIKLGMDTKQVIGRFEAERQALAMMDHPNIAKVLDAGATETGRPYFVMELVRGETMTDYCDESNLAINDRLALFINVCHAVEHAHQKGVIHRDIKPSNVIVTLVDDSPVPKVIDFGIAKATEKRRAEQTSLTSDGQFLGTPQYMSPEQAGMSDLHVDIRTDIYSLGVLLYELLTGRTPLDLAQLRQAGYDDMCRIIRETDPPTPSKCLTTLGAATTEVARRRQVPPTALRKLLRGDLDCIVMKTLEKNRDDRYATAQALAKDLRRFLDNNPITAKRPTPMARVTKWSKRHSWAVATFTASTLCVLLTALIVLWFGQRREAALRERAERNLQLALNGNRSQHRGCKRRNLKLGTANER